MKKGVNFCKCSKSTIYSFKKKRSVIKVVYLLLSMTKAFICNKIIHVIKLYLFSCLHGFE